MHKQAVTNRLYEVIRLAYSFGSLFWGGIHITCYSITIDIQTHLKIFVKYALLYLAIGIRDGRAFLLLVGGGALFLHITLFAP